MLTDNLTLISFLSSIILLAVVSIYSYFIFKKEKKFEEIEIKAYRDAKNILEKAHEKSEAILDKTLEKSKDILLQTELFKQYIEKDLKKTLKLAIEEYSQVLKGNSKEIVDSYTNLFKTFKEHYVTETNKLIKELESSGEKGLQDSSATLKQELLNSQQELKKKVDQEFERARKEIEEYKKQELANADKTLKKALVSLSEEILGKTIPLNDHEKLILEALEKAKKEGIFNV